MDTELESVWGAMKAAHYRRTIEQIRVSVEQTRNLEGALSGALELVVPACHAVTGTFWFFDRFGDGRIRPKAVYGGGNLGGISLAPGEGIAGQVIKNGRSTIVADCQSDPRWAGKADAKTGFRTESMVCVPLMIEDNAFGCIQLLNRTDHVLFDESDLAFAEQLGEATADLFRRQGLLDAYLPSNAAAEQAREVTFMDVFGAQDEKEFIFQLHRVDAFANLRVSEQDAVAKLAREMREFFVKKRRRGFFR